MPTQASPYSLVADIREKAERLRMQEVRQAVRGSIAAHSITADKIAVGALFVGGPGAAGTDGNVPVDPGSIVASNLSVGSLSAITATLGSVTAGSITATDFTGGTINGTTINGVSITGSSSITGGTITGTSLTGVTIQLGSGSPHIYGDSTGIRAVGDGASYRFFDGSETYRMGAARCNTPTIGGNTYTEVELTAYTNGISNSTANTYAQLTTRNGVTDAGGTFYVKVRANGNVEASSTISVTSDRKLKRRIRDVRDPLAAVMALRPRTFERKGMEGSHAGFIAQEVERALPALVTDHDVRGKVVKGIVHDGIHAYTVGAIQELARRVDELEARPVQ
jgi:hypothetical protein